MQVIQDPSGGPLPVSPATSDDDDPVRPAPLAAHVVAYGTLVVYLALLALFLWVAAGDFLGAYAVLTPLALGTSLFLRWSARWPLTLPTRFAQKRYLLLRARQDEYASLRDTATEAPEQLTPEEVGLCVGLFGVSVLGRSLGSVPVLFEALVKHPSFIPGGSGVPLDAPYVDVFSHTHDSSCGGDASGGDDCS